MPVPGAIAQVALLRQHVAHGCGFHRRQFVFVDRRFDGLNHLRFGLSGKKQVRLLDGSRKVGARGSRIEADRSSPLWIPETGSSIGDVQERSTMQTKPFLPWTAVS